ncbi:MAG: SpoIVB peptidase [Oscillospiraceae bacterium]|nr:SpoIVB peptidase [Oscillospiraceae bacterium]
MRKFVKTVTSTFLVMTLLLCTVVGFYYARLPDKYYLSDNAPFTIDAFFDIVAHSANDNADSLPVYAASDGSSDEVDLRLFGMIPIKRAAVQHIDRPLLVPQGTPFGIKILTDGAIVTEFGMVDGQEGMRAPARDGGVKVGDVVVQVNGVPTRTNGDVSEAVQLNPDNTEVVLIRDGKQHTVNLQPARSNQDGLYKIGMWVRDSSAGIGTMTFYDPAERVFAGLGHAVCDIDTGQILPLSSGNAVPVYISGVVKGYAGAPGELCGTFMSRTAIGTIERNTEVGLFGIADDYEQMQNDANDNESEIAENAQEQELEPIEMAYKQEVRVGAATLLTTIDGDTAVSYDVIIEKIDYNDRNGVKNMVVKVTDRALLNQAGGIVQGMSGSPLIQDGRLVGAVTHVFVSDPTRGYAIFAENMYRESLKVETPVQLAEVEPEWVLDDAA